TVGGTGALMVLWYGGHLAIAGQLTIGNRVGFLGYLGQLAWPTMALGWMLSILQRGRAAMQRLNELLQVTPAIASPPGATAPAAVAGEVALRGVTFRYPGRLDRTPVLDDVDVTVPAGRTVAIVGRTGAGKSALVQLLPRLFDVEAGSVLLDGALSSVDAETERTILDQLRGFFRERTTILVAHRLTTVKEADLICVLDEGRVVELGDHESLLARGGVYADLFRQQSLEVELEAI